MRVTITVSPTVERIEQAFEPATVGGRAARLLPVDLPAAGRAELFKLRLKRLPCVLTRA
jgi:hypothetical protein